VVYEDETNIELRKAKTILKLEKQYIEACEKDENVSVCKQIKLNAQKKTKLGLGKFLLLKIIQ
jgi:hypothetical protein